MAGALGAPPGLWFLTGTQHGPWNSREPIALGALGSWGGRCKGWGSTTGSAFT